MPSFNDYHLDTVLMPMEAKDYTTSSYSYQTDSEYRNENSFIKCRKLQGVDLQFECSFCRKKFLYFSLLQQHLRVHTKEKPFVCTLCNKAFTRQSSLKKHSVIHN